MRRISPLSAVFLTIFFDILSFGSIIPDVQLRAEQLVRDWGSIGGISLIPYTGVLIGFTIALYSIAQFAMAPFLGRLSDHAGRRRVLIITASLAVLSSAMYAYSHHLAIMWLSRILLGLAGANLGVAQAYIADVTTPEERSKSMGILGLAFGLGFMLGPPFGVWLLYLGNDSPFWLGWGSAILAGINLLFIIFFLPEPNVQRVPPTGKTNRMEQIKVAFGTPEIRLLLVLFFVANFAFTNLESTYYLVGEFVYKISKAETTIVLVVVGIIAAVVQGGLIRLLIPKFGERNLIKAGYILQTPAIAAIPFVMPWWPVILGAVVLGTGSGISQPSLSGLISKAAPKEMQGGVFGVTQSLGAFARILGPILANWMFQIQTWLPYIVAGTLMLGPTVMAWFLPEPKEQRSDSDDLISPEASS